VIRRVLALLACVVALGACRVDIAVDMTMTPEGTGTITVITTADGEVVAAVPTIADELATDDIAAAGWAIDGPTPTADGGLTLTLRHDFASPEEATNLLNSLGPPFNQMSVRSNTIADETTIRLSGLLGLSDGFESFADAELIAAVGSVPFADAIAASGATPETSMSAIVRAELPGVVDPERTNATAEVDGRLEWTIPLDGTILEWRAVTTQAPGGEDRWWARPLSVIALVALIVWVSFMTIFIVYVAAARWRRALRYRRRHPRGPAPADGG
jgi:hypothetical protein